MTRGASTGFALALGSGGARGLAHIPILEALDDLGVRPVAIAGTSMGAIFGAAYAAGMSGAEMREAVLAVMADRRGLYSRLLGARSGRLADLFNGLGHPMMIDALTFCELFLPTDLPETFEDCATPLTVVAADFHARTEAAFTTGPLRKAVAASMAIPGLIRPIDHHGRILVDGGLVNPVPFDHLTRHDVPILAIDVNGQPREGDDLPPPGLWDALFASIQIMQGAIAVEKLRNAPDTVMIRPDVGRFRALDFPKVSVILRQAQPAREDAKRAIEAMIERKRPPRGHGGKRQEGERPA